MKHLLLPFILLLTVACCAQIDTSEKEYLFVDPEIPPQFPGGDIALLKFVQSNTVYPAVQMDDTLVEHRVIINFTVTEHGKVSNIVVRRSAGKAFDDEALRIVSLLPDFEPGKQGGKPIKMQYTLPIRFRKRL